MEASQEVNKKEQKAAQTLIDAVLVDDLRQLESLLADGFNPNSADDHGLTALMVAAGRGKLGLVKLLLSKGADVNTQNYAGKWPMGGKTALMFAASEGHLATVNEILLAGSTLDTQDADGETALMKAASNGHFEVVKLLLSAGADVRIENKNGETALAQAESMGQLKIAELLKSTL